MTVSRNLLGNLERKIIAFKTLFHYISVFYDDSYHHAGSYAAPWLIAVTLNAAAGREFDVRNAAATGLGILFFFTGIGHFVQVQPMVQMLPPWGPERLLLVHASGILEFAIALGFLIPKFRRVTGLTAAAVLVLFFPLNIYAALNYVPMGGHAWGAVYLLIRAPLQAIILGWVYWFTIRITLQNKFNSPLNANATRRSA